MLLLYLIKNMQIIVCMVRFSMSHILLLYHFIISLTIKSDHVLMEFEKSLSVGNSKQCNF